MRLLTLADLGASKESLSFAEIAVALSVPESEVWTCYYLGFMTFLLIVCVLG